jgi:pimeloyl-ACP methyl ester carboxylesterase
MQKSISFRNREGLTLRGVVHRPKGYSAEKGIAVLLLHGFPGSGFRKSSRRYAVELERKGYLCMRFDFSGTNKSDGNFADKLMSREVDEVKYAIDFLQKNFGFKKLVLYGHSTGAIDASLYSCRDKRISKLILSGGLLHLNNAARYDFTDENVKDFWTKGYIVYGRKKGWRKSWVTGKRLKKAFYDEFFTLDIPGSMRKYKKPLLVIHGEKDEAVPLKCALELYAFAHKPKKLIVVKGADHSYKKPAQFRKAIAEICRFIGRK